MHSARPAKFAWFSKKLLSSHDSLIDWFCSLNFQKNISQFQELRGKKLKKNKSETFFSSFFLCEIEFASGRSWRMNEQVFGVCWMSFYYWQCFCFLQSLCFAFSFLNEAQPNFSYVTQKHEHELIKLLSMSFFSH